MPGNMPSSAPSQPASGSTSSGGVSPPITEDYLDETLRATNLPPFACQEDIVIAGIAGRVAGCHNFTELEEALFSKKDLLTTTEEAGRYENGLFGNQVEFGAMPDIDKFDASFFNMYPYMVSATDPTVRMLLERVYEALVDAGESMESIQGTSTSVICGGLTSDSIECCLQMKRINNYSYIGYVPCHQANRISFTFDVKGPSFFVDSACSSSLAAVETAINHIRMGYSEAAIIASGNLVQNPWSSYTATHVGMLSSSGRCKAFDRDGDGFVRADGNMAMYICKRSQAKRVYATIMHIRGNNDGFTREGFSVPSGESQSQLIQNVYNDLGIDPNIVKFAECHGPGTQVGDGIEVDALAKYFCTNRVDPLHVGSVKSVIAHCEGAAGLASLSKCLIGLNNKLIPPNMHFDIPNPNIKSLFDGRVKVATEPIPLESGIVSCSSFGVGGTNYNICLRAYKNENRPPHPASKETRLFVYGCRTQEAAMAILDEVRQHSHNVEYQGLLEPTANQPTAKLSYRFYDVLNTKTRTYTAVKKQDYKKRQVWLSFSGMGTQWAGMGREMMKMEVFRNSIQLSSNFLKERYGFDLLKEITGNIDESFKSATSAFIGITAIEIALFDLITKMGIEWDYCMGHSLGEAAAAYADGSITHEEAILISYWRGTAATSCNTVPGKMIAAALDWDEALAMCPKDCWPACHNYKRNVTISGKVAATEKLCAELQSQGYFSREVFTYDRAFHCPLVNEMVPMMRKHLSALIKTRPKSPRLLSTSIPQDKWHLDSSQNIGAEYFINNLLNPVLYYEVATLIPDDAIIIEMSPNAIFFGTLKKTIPSSAVVVSTMRADQEDNVEFFLNQMGQVYINGVNMKPLNLYQPIQFPVPKGTPMTSVVANKMWDHTVSWDTPKVVIDRDDQLGFECMYEVDFSKTDDAYFKSYVVNGENIFPPGGYLMMAWKTLAHLKKQKPFEEMAVVLEDVEFLENRTLNNGETIFTCSLQTNGTFEIRESKIPLVKGYIRPADCDENSYVWPDIQSGDLDKEQFVWTKDGIYEWLCTEGRNFGSEFTTIVRASHNFTKNEIEWNNKWEVRMESMLQCAAMCQLSARPGHVVSIGRMDIRPAHHIEEHNKVCEVQIDPVTNILTGGNVVMYDVTCAVDTTPANIDDCILGKRSFEAFHQVIRPKVSVNLYASNIIEMVNQLLESKSFEQIENVNKSNTPPMKQSLLQLMDKLFEIRSTTNGLDNCVGLMESMVKEIDMAVAFTSLDVKSILETCLDIVVQNVPSKDISVIELDAKSSNMYTTILSSLAKNPELSVSYRVADNQDMTDDISNLGMAYSNWSLNDNLTEELKKSNLVVSKNALSKSSNLDEALTKLDSLLAPGGFALIQESTKDIPLISALDRLLSKIFLNRHKGFPDSVNSLTEAFSRKGFEVIYRRSDSLLYNVYLIRKAKAELGDNCFVDISDAKGSWLPQLQKSYLEMSSSDDSNSRMWLYSTTATTGLSGLMASLKNEVGGGGQKLRGIIAPGDVIKGGKLSLKSAAFQMLSKKDLVMNEYRDGIWGMEVTTSLDAACDTKDIKSTEAYLSLINVGEETKLTFLQTPSTSPPTTNAKNDTGTISVYYAGIGHRDVQVANGEGHRSDNDPDTFGVDFVGRNEAGDRVMGFAVGGAIRTELDGDNVSTICVPPSMSMKDAASILTAYATAGYVFKVLTDVKHGQSLLVNSGDTNVGQALISTALQHGLDVFSTVRTEEGRRRLMERFPKLDKSHVISSANTSCFQVLMAKTKGKGLDMVINASTHDNPTEAIRQVTTRGYLIDLFGATATIAGHRVLKNKNILQVDMYHVLTSQDTRNERKKLINWLQTGLVEGSIRPMQIQTFGVTQVEEAFHSAVNGDIMGTASIEFRHEEETAKTNGLPLEIPISPRFTCNPDLCYVVIGGLEAPGLEIARWLTQHGCKKQVLAGSNGVMSVYQHQRVELMKSQGVTVRVWSGGCSSLHDVTKLMDVVQGIGPFGGVIIAPQAPLSECPLSDTTLKEFQTMMNDQMATVQLMDSITRDQKLRKSTHLFCVFRPLTRRFCQSKTALVNFTNDKISRIVNNRRLESLPGIVVEIGSLAGTSTTGNKMPLIENTHAQNMTSLLNSLDNFISCDQCVTSCYVIPSTNDEGEKLQGTPIQLAVAMELGIRDFSDYDQDATLVDLGMDSIVGNQAVAMLASKFDIEIDSKELIELTIDELGQLGS